MSAERLKVLFITHSFPRSGSGSRSSALGLLADALAAQGVMVRVVAPDMRGEKRNSGEDSRVERFRVAMPRPRGVASSTAAPGGEAEGAPHSSEAVPSRRSTMNYLGAGFGKAVKARRDFEPDVVHAHWWFPSGLVGSWVSSLASLPLVTSLHGANPQSARAGSPTRPLFRHVLRRSAAVTVESGAEARRLASVLNGVTPVVAPLPFAVEHFQPGEQRTERATLLLDDDDMRDPAGVAMVVRGLADMGLEVALVRTGKDPGQLNAIIQEAGAGAQSFVVDGRRTERLATVMGESRVCVALTGGESHREALSAAMLCATPLAILGGSSVEGESSEQLRLSLKLEGDSVQDRLRGLQRVLAEDDVVAGQVEAARMYALATLSPESCAARMLGVYLRALGDAAA